MVVPCGVIGPVFNLLERHGAERLSEEFSSSGELLLRVAVVASDAAGMTAAITNATSGCVVPSRV